MSEAEPALTPVDLYVSLLHDAHSQAVAAGIDPNENLKLIQEASHKFLDETRELPAINLGTEDSTKVSTTHVNHRTNNSERLPHRIPRRDHSTRPSHYHGQAMDIIPETSIDEMLAVHYEMPHMVSGNQAPIANQPMSQPTRDLVKFYWKAHWRAATQIGYEEGQGKIRSFMTASKIILSTVLGVESPLNDPEAIAAKKVEVDRALELASIMISNGQDVSDLAEKYPAVKDYCRYLQRLEHDAAPHASLTYMNGSQKVIGGSLEPDKKPRVIVDGEDLSWVEAMQALDDQVENIISKHSQTNSVEA